jgi:hypothetical protein
MEAYEEDYDDVLHRLSTELQRLKQFENFWRCVDYILETEFEDFAEQIYRHAQEMVDAKEWGGREE